MNRELASKGQSAGGLRFGASLEQLARAGDLQTDLRSAAEILTAQAVDARMGGVPAPAMSIAGSGDHGIVASLPVYAVWKKLGLDKDRLKRALALSFLVTLDVVQ